jgi:hypothetical protein
MFSSLMMSATGGNDYSGRRQRRAVILDITWTRSNNTNCALCRYAFVHERQHPASCPSQKTASASVTCWTTAVPAVHEAKDERTCQAPAAWCWPPCPPLRQRLRPTNQTHAPSGRRAWMRAAALRLPAADHYMLGHATTAPFVFPSNER